MKSETLYRVSGWAVMVGAMVGATTTAIELITSPYNLYGSALWLNPWVHLAKYLALIVLIVGLPGVFVRQREHAGKLGFISLAAMCLGLAAAGVPYNVVEWSVDPALGQQEAAIALDNIYGTGSIWLVLGMPGFLAFLLGYLIFGIATLRAKILPRWTAMLSLASIVAGIASVFVDLALPGLVPHPPAWLLLGLIGYGYALAHAPLAATDSAAALTHDRATPRVTGGG
jgi:hypothetical protein